MTDHATKGTDPFTHDADIKSGRVAAAVHESLDPARKNKAGKNIRESFDSDVHPDSVAVGVLWDVTGSMSTVPRIFLEKMPKLMAALVKKGYVAHPHVLFGAIGDATCDRVPLQVGQFEGGNEMDEALTNIVLESGGGGHITESYELGMYFMARHTDIDCVKKRGKKGYLFFLGDELPYPRVKKSEVERIIGDVLEADIPTPQILEELREKFEVFWIMPEGTTHANDPEVCEPLKKMFGQNFLRLENPGDVCELIATTIGLMEGYDLDGIKDDLKDIGADAGAINRATTALTTFASKAVTKGATASGALAVAGDDGVARL
jgi:hypothetical protein